MLYHRGVSPSCREGLLCYTTAVCPLHVRREGLSCYTTAVCPLHVERVYRAISQRCVPFMCLACKGVGMLENLGMLLLW